VTLNVRRRLHGYPPSAIGSSLLLLPVVGSLPQHVTSTPCMSLFLGRLKAYLFRGCFPCHFTATFVVPAQWNSVIFGHLNRSYFIYSFTWEVEMTFKKFQLTMTSRNTAVSHERYYYRDFVSARISSRRLPRRLAATAVGRWHGNESVSGRPPAAAAEHQRPGPGRDEWLATATQRWVKRDVVTWSCPVCRPTTACVLHGVWDVLPGS